MIGSKSVSLNKCLSNDSWRSHVAMCWTACYRSPRKLPSITYNLFSASHIILTQDLEDESAEHRLKHDEDRKYGTIPKKIYLLYLKACGIPTLVVFFMSTFMWQALRVYTDVWLRDWTDSDAAGTDVWMQFESVVF